MAEPPNARRPGEMPQSVVQTSRRFRPQLVWLIPIIAALIGGWLVAKTLLERGPTVTITFLTAQGIDAGKTKIKYKSVDVGEVRAVNVSDDNSKVIVTAEFTKPATKYLVQDTRFWVVRPRIGVGGVSGLSTLFSGAYIGMDLGRSTESRRAYEGLEVPPIITSENAGREFILHSDDLGSLDVGAPIYFRHVEVGDVVAFTLDPDGRGVTLRIFINSPYEKYVTRATRFWHASGVDMTLDANGIRVQTESIATILSGGIAFEAPPNSYDNEPVAGDTKFELANDRVEAFRTADLIRKPFLLYFANSVRGLSPGAPVDFGGITIGQVKSIDVEYDPQSETLRFPVQIDVFPDRLQGRMRKGTAAAPAHGAPREQLLQSLVRQGYRAQLRTGNLLTGQLYVAFDRFTGVPPVRIDFNKEPPVLPTTPGGLQQLQETLTKIGDKVEKLPLDELIGDARQALKSLDRTLQSADQLVKNVDGQVAPGVVAVLNEARGTLGATNKILSSSSPQLAAVRQALVELTRTLEAVRVLAETLEKNPESLVRGKPKESP